MGASCAAPVRCTSPHRQLPREIGSKDRTKVAGDRQPPRFVRTTHDERVLRRKPRSSQENHERCDTTNDCINNSKKLAIREDMQILTLDTDAAILASPLVSDGVHAEEECETARSANDDGHDGLSRRKPASVEVESPKCAAEETCTAWPRTLARSVSHRLKAVFSPNARLTKEAHEAHIRFAPDGIATPPGTPLERLVSHLARYSPKGSDSSNSERGDVDSSRRLRRPWVPRFLVSPSGSQSEAFVRPRHTQGLTFDDVVTEATHGIYAHMVKWRHVSPKKARDKRKTRRSSSLPFYLQKPEVQQVRTGEKAMLPQKLKAAKPLPGKLVWRETPIKI